MSFLFGSRLAGGAKSTKKKDKAEWSIQTERDERKRKLERDKLFRHSKRRKKKEKPHVRYDDETTGTSS